MRRSGMNVASDGADANQNVVLRRRRQPPKRTRQRLPASVRFLPHLHNADLVLVTLPPLFTPRWVTSAPDALRSGSSLSASSHKR
jgi:hypothetical protein